MGENKNAIEIKKRKLKEEIDKRELKETLKEKVRNGDKIRRLKESIRRHKEIAINIKRKHS